MPTDALFDSGVRPFIDAHLDELSQERRDYGDYWSASSAGYCQRKNIFERLKVPYVSKDARTQRIFSAGHIFHEWIQGITEAAGVSVAQETELQDETLKVRGHIDDLIAVDGKLLLVDYKTQNSRAFTWQKGRPMSHYHTMQLGTYLYMLRNNPQTFGEAALSTADLDEARILKISKDDLRMAETQLLWTSDLHHLVAGYWRTQNEAWEQYQQTGALPKCSCADYENGFMASDKYNPFHWAGEPCSQQWHDLWKQDQLHKNKEAANV